MKKISARKLDDFKKTKFSRFNLLIFVLIFGVIGGYLLIFKGSALGCTITAPGSASDRKVSITMSGCAGTQYFRVSESQDFGASNGVQVHINNVAADKSYADVSVSYPNGTPATGSTPFTLPGQQHQIRVLAVLFTFQDDSAQTAGLGDYETTSWVQKLVFGGGSFDGTFTNNSIKDFVTQSTNGQVNLAGSVYPQIIKLPLEKYRQMLGSSGNVQARFGEDILRTIKDSNPGYLDNYDFLIGLSSEQYAVSRNLFPTGSGASSVRAGDYGSIKNFITYSIPVDLSKSIFANTIQETRTSMDANTVVTRYNPSSGPSLEGVWLASDSNRTGTNYYTGGSLTTTPDTMFSYIRLGTALPSANTQVIVRYKASISTTVNTSSADQVSTYSWYSHFMHELHHQISSGPVYSFGGRDALGDLYYLPGLGGQYDLMANGVISGQDPVVNKSIDSPSLLGAFHRSVEGFATPYTVQYGQNEASVRLYRIENGDPANNSRTTMIKVPLMPRGDEGLETRDYVGSSNPVSPTTPSRQYRGNEYLLLEWRYKGEGLENGMYNFDRLVTSEGMAVHHVIENRPYGITAATYDIARVQDATPDNSNFSDSYSDTASSPALFGPQSGVMTYNASAYWQEKTPNNDTHSFEYLLAPGAGTKTLYAQFADSNGTILGTQQVSVNLTTSQQPSDRLPTMSIDMPDGTSISTFRTVRATYSALNGAKSMRFYIDGVLKQDHDDSISCCSIPAGSDSYIINTSNYSPGSHQLNVVFYDAALNKVTASANFTTVGGGDATSPSISIGSPASNSTVWGTIQVMTNSIDNVGVVKSELYLDGNVVVSTKASTILYNWYTTQVPNGAHTLTAKAYDAAGRIGTSAPVTVNINNAGGTSDTTPPTVSLTSPTAGSTVSSLVSINANASDNTGVTKVDFLVDGTIANTDSTTPYSYSWDSNTVSNGSHVLSATAYDSAGNSTSDQVSVTVANLDTTPPSTPTNLSASASAYNRVNLSWTASTDNVSVAGYYIVQNGVTIAQIIGTGTTYTDTTVSASTAYNYQVMAFDARNNISALSNTANVTTPAAPDTTPPSVPTNLSATAVSSSQINLAWNPSTDNIGVTAYDVYRNNTKITTLTASTACTVSTCSYGNTGLSPSTTYSYYVIAKDSAGNSSPQSNTASAITQAVQTTGNLVGTVFSSRGGTLTGATITIKFGGANHTYTSGANGTYSIVSIPPGSYSVKYSANGFNTQTVSVSITIGQTATKNITLISRK